MLGNAFRNANDERDFSGQGLFDTGGSDWGPGHTQREEISICDVIRGGSSLKVSESKEWCDEGAGSYGTKMALAVAPVSFTASETFAKTGRSRCVWPAFLGFVPPTTLVPTQRKQAQLAPWTVIKELNYPPLFRHRLRLP